MTSFALVLQVLGFVAVAVGVFVLFGFGIGVLVCGVLAVIVGAVLEREHS